MPFKLIISVDLARVINAHFELEVSFKKETMEGFIILTIEREKDNVGEVVKYKSKKLSDNFLKYIFFQCRSWMLMTSILNLLLGSKLARSYSMK